MNEDLDHVVQRTRQYWFSDGIVELSVGGLFLILGFYFYLQSTLSAASLLLISFQVGFVFLLFGAIYLSRYLVSKLKSRLTTPRTGFVSYKRASKKQRIVSISIVCLIAVINAALFLATPLSLNWIPAITGSIVGSLWLISALRVGLFRFYLQSILAFLLGVLLSLTSLDVYQSLALFYGILGSVLLLSGGVTLANYLHQHPSLEEKTQS
ncbi:MAG TPA: hypothetical protein VMW34_15195 [Anaerolineales bacterium]|nr:hypothetical protein [Anaerolineales bacterium]